MRLRWVPTLIWFSVWELWASVLRADEAVDLSDLGFDSFAPYSFERNAAWALLPLFALLVVIWHLRAGRN